MAWAAIGKVVARGARRVATDKLLNRKKNVKKRGGKAQAAMQEGGEEKGGQLMIRPSTSLVPSGPSGIIPAPPSDTGGSDDTSDIEGALMTIQTKVVRVENLLKGSQTMKEKIREDQRQASKDAEDKQQEKALESKQPKKEGKGKFKMPKVPLPTLLSTTSLTFTNSSTFHSFEISKWLIIQCLISLLSFSSTI